MAPGPSVAGEDLVDTRRALGARRRRRRKCDVARASAASISSSPPASEEGAEEEEAAAAIRWRRCAAQSDVGSASVGCAGYQGHRSLG